MAENREIHFAADEEQLERFVLRKATDADRKSAEEHLATCASCAAAVRKERLLAAGVRRLGRDQFRRSLKQRLEGARNSAGPWLRILSAAAVVAIIAGVGFYNNWFRENKELLGVEADKPIPEHVTRDEMARDNDPSARTRTHPPVAFQQKEDVSSADSRREAPLSAKTEPIGNDEEKGMFADRVTGSGARSDIAAASPSTVQSGQAAQVYWTEGVTLDQAGEPLEAEAVKKSAVESSASKELSRAKTSRDDANENAQGRLEGAGSNYRISQRPVSALPHEQRMKQQYRVQNRVQTKIEQRPGMTEMTLYLDSLIDAKEVQRANVETVSGDSLVVNMGNQRIGYKLPAGYNTQEQLRQNKSR